MCGMFRSFVWRNSCMVPGRIHECDMHHSEEVSAKRNRERQREKEPESKHG